MNTSLYLILALGSFGEPSPLGTSGRDANKESAEEKEATAFRSSDVICTKRRNAPRCKQPINMRDALSSQCARRRRRWGLFAKR